MVGLPLTLKIFMFHQDGLEGLKSSLASLHTAWNFYSRAPGRRPLLVTLTVADEGTPPPRDLEIERILARERQVLPWHLKAVRVPLNRPRDRWFTESSGAAPGETCLFLEAGTRAEANLFLELSALRWDDRVSYQIPSRRESGSFASVVDGDRFRIREAALGGEAPRAFAWNGFVGTAAAFARIGARGSPEVGLPESVALDLSLGALEAGIDMRSLPTTSLHAPAAAPTRARELRRFEERILIALRRIPRGRRGPLALKLVPELLMGLWRFGGPRDADKRSRLMRAWRRLLR